MICFCSLIVMLIVSCRVHGGTFIRITMTPTVSRCSCCALRDKVKKKRPTPLVSSSPATDIRSRQHLKSVSRLDRPIAVSVATQTTIIILIVIVAVVMLIFSYNICPCLLLLVGADCRGFHHDFGKSEKQYSIPSLLC